MASAAEVAELKAELERMKTHTDAKEAEFSGYFKMIHEQTVKYDPMSSKFEQLNDSCRK